MSSTFVKPLVAGAAAAALDRYALMNTDQRHNMYFGAAVAGGSFVSGMITPALPSLIPNILPDGLDEKTLTQRLVDIGVTSGAAWVLNSKVLNNAYSRDELIKQIGVIAASQFIGEYASDYMSNRNLSYLA